MLNFSSCYFIFYSVGEKRQKTEKERRHLICNCTYLLFIHVYVCIQIILLAARSTTSSTILDYITCPTVTICRGHLFILASLLFLHQPTSPPFLQVFQPYLHLFNLAMSTEQYHNRFIRCTSDMIRPDIKLGDSEVKSTSLLIYSPHGYSIALTLIVHPRFYSIFISYEV